MCVCFINNYIKCIDSHFFNFVYFTRHISSPTSTVDRAFISLIYCSNFVSFIIISDISVLRSFAYCFVSSVEFFSFVIFSNVLFLFKYKIKINMQEEYI